ncbi:MAG: hypothetical protein Q8R02_11765 [Hyphomonadaceae bacterium]|nr:hypothetical protein [Hyphomonadaceae bacterium]
MADAQALLVYWPTAAVAAALLAVLLTLMWIVKCIPRMKIAMDAIGKSRKALDEARVQAKTSLKGVKARRTEMQGMHKTAGQQFWRTEKTWIG